MITLAGFIDVTNGLLSRFSIQVQEAKNSETAPRFSSLKVGQLS